MQRAYWPTKQWREAPPERVGMNADLPAKADAAIKAQFPTINSIIAVKQGYLVFERYYHGCDSGMSHHVASVTKSVTSALIGIAIAQGRIAGVEQRVLDFFPEYSPGKQDALKQELTIYQLLTMTSGLQWRTGARAYEPMLDRLRRSPDWVDFILRLPIQQQRIGSFQYNSAGSHLLSVVLTRATGICAREFANRYLFEPLGIEPIPDCPPGDYSQEAVFGANGPQWPEDPQGNTFGGWGLSLTPREMAKFGYLYLNHGQWEHQGIVPEQWVRESTKAYTQGFGGYGYHWWVNETRGMTNYSAIGRGGHHICCVPEKDLVIVIASKMAGRWRDRRILIDKYLLPAAGEF